MIDFLALLLAIVVPVYAALLFGFALFRRRRTARSWRAWHRLQAGRAFAWRALFGRSQLRLTHADPEAGPPPA